jgi:hypothetical protein
MTLKANFSIRCAVGDFAAYLAHLTSRIGRQSRAPFGLRIVTGPLMRVRSLTKCLLS